MNKNSIRISYAKSTDYKSSLCNGAYGGISNKGIFEVNFYTDRINLPQDQEIEFEGNTAKQNPNDIVATGTLREIQFGLFMDLKTARIVADWLNKTLDENQIPQIS